MTEIDESSGLQTPVQGTNPNPSSDTELLLNLHPPHWRNPVPTHCYNIVIVGAGPAGICAARRAARMGARVALIERNRLGGSNQNVGTVPGKALIRTSRAYWDMANAGRFGAQAMPVCDHDFRLAANRKLAIEAKISRRYSAELLAEEGIDVFFGEGIFAGRSTIRVSDVELRFKRAIVATGARRRAPHIAGDGICTTVAELFARDEPPKRIMFVGGGPLGTELAQAYARFGSQVFLVHNKPKFLPSEERDAALFLTDVLREDGVEIHLNTQAESISRVADGLSVKLSTMSKPYSISVDTVVAGVGRQPNIEQLGLKTAGVEIDLVTGIVVDDFLRTSNRRIYAVGDVCLSERYTHVAEASARFAVDNALLMHRRRLSRIVVPRCTYTDPEVAHVGIQVAQANKLKIPVRTFTIMMHEVDRAVIDSEEKGFVKIHVREGTDRILGATIVARHAGEMINEITLAMQHGMGLRKLSTVNHAYPTQAAAIKLAADACEEERYPQILRKLAAVWLKWQLR